MNIVMSPKFSFGLFCLFVVCNLTAQVWGRLPRGSYRQHSAGEDQGDEEVPPRPISD